MSTAATASEVALQRRGRLACITLTRPKALNALTLPMVRELHAALDQSSSDPSVSCILLSGEGKAFCAGGDVKGLMLAALKEPPARGALADAFFREEYQLNAVIAASQKPQVSIWDGFCMGGGAGISVHGAFRIATEKTVFAMPETNIGMFPDVGASFFLSTLPGSLGPCLALTGARLGPADVLYTGLATHYIPSSSIPELIRKLEACDNAAAAVRDACDSLAADPGTPPLAAVRPTIDRCFGHDSVEEILAALRGMPESDWAHETLVGLHKMSPTACKVTLRLLREAKGLSLDACLRAEFRACQRFMLQPSDFFEGIRAALVDKDKSPRWDPPTIADVTDEHVDEFFVPLGERELQLGAQE